MHNNYKKNKTLLYLIILGCIATTLYGCGSIDKKAAQTTPPKNTSTNEASLQAQTNFCTGVYYMLAGQWRTATHFFETAAKLQPGEERILHHLTACYYQLEEGDKALQTLEKTSELLPDDFNTHYLFATMCESEGKVDKAILGYERAIKCKRENDSHTILTNADIYYRLGQLYAKKGDFQRSIDYYLKLMETGIVREPAKLQCEIGQTYLNNNDVENAVHAFSEAGKSDPDLALVHFFLAICYERLGNVEMVITESEKYLEKDPDNWILLLGLAELYEKTDQAERVEPLEQKALTVLSESISKGSVNSDEYLSYSRLLLKQDQKEEALDVLLQATTIPLDSKTERDIHYNLASLYYEINRYDKVEEELKIALEIDPDCHQANNFLGYLYVEEGYNLNDAIQLIKKALEAEPENGAYLDSLGWAYYKEATVEGKTDKLELALEKLTVAAQNTEDPIILEHLGEVYYSLGHWEKAEELWKRAIELQKEGEEKKKETFLQHIRKRIEKLQRLKSLESTMGKVVINYAYQ